MSDPLSIKFHWSGNSREKFEQRLREHTPETEYDEITIGITLNLFDASIESNGQKPIRLVDERDAAAVFQTLCLDLGISKSEDGRTLHTIESRRRYIVRKMKQNDWDPLYDFGAEIEESDIRVDIIIREVDGKHRIGFPGWRPEWITAERLQSEFRKAMTYFQIHRMDPGTKLGSMIVRSGEYHHTEWCEFQYVHPPDENDFQHGLSTYVTPEEQGHENIEVQIWSDGTR